MLLNSGGQYDEMQAVDLLSSGATPIFWQEKSRIISIFLVKTQGSVI